MSSLPLVRPESEREASLAAVRGYAEVLPQAGALRVPLRPVDLRVRQQQQEPRGARRHRAQDVAQQVLLALRHPL